MVGTVLANVGLTGQIPDRADGWGSAMNLNLLLIDSLISQKALSNSITTPPTSPALGDVYIVPSGATGAWSAAVNKLAVWTGGTWTIVHPKNGWRFYVVSTAIEYLFNGTAWISTQAQQKPFKFAQYTASTLPPAGQWEGYIVEQTDAPGGAKLMRSNGTAWVLVNPPQFQ